MGCRNPSIITVSGRVMLHHHGFAMSEVGNTGGDYFEG